MSELNARLKYLIEQYSSQAITEAEEQELLGLLGNPANDEIETVLSELIEQQEPLPDEKRSTRLLNQILADESFQPIEDAPVKQIFGWRKIAAAAAILILVSVGGYLLLKPKPTQPLATNEPQETRFKNDVAAPATTKATITLADGKTIALDSVTNGLLANEGAVKVEKNVDGEVVYSGNETAALHYNTLANPRGSKVISLVLADGSKVWLDAASSITYPTAFNGKERNVTITGQAYFEVAHNANMPFKVKKQSDDAEVQVLGTHFNVMAFDDEQNIQVTLLEGSVRVTKNTTSVLLKPGQQASVQGATVGQFANPDLEEAMAWKNGVFRFKEITVEPLMKQLARWYDLDIVFEEKPSGLFVSTIPRDMSAIQVLKILEATGRVHFKIEGKKVSVIK